MVKVSPSEEYIESRKESHSWLKKRASKKIASEFMQKEKEGWRKVKEAYENNPRSAFTHANLLSFERLVNSRAVIYLETQ